MLLALLWIRPRSGSELRKLFLESSVGRFTAGGGSVYPTLRRMEGLELIVGESDAGQRAHRTVYTLTRDGERTLMGWLRAPVLDEEVRTAPELTCFRLALLPDVAEPDESVRRFEELEHAIDGQIRLLMSYLANPPSSDGPREAAELALDLWATRGGWARRMLSTLRAQRAIADVREPTPHYTA